MQLLGGFFLFDYALYLACLFCADLISKLLDPLTLLRLDLLFLDVLDQQILQSISQQGRKGKQATHGDEDHERPQQPSHLKFTDHESLLRSLSPLVVS